MVCGHVQAGFWDHVRGRRELQKVQAVSESTLYQLMDALKRTLADMQQIERVLRGEERYRGASSSFHQRLSF